jgi:hypothetical protein
MAAQQPDIKRTDLQQHNLSIPGHEVVQALVDLGPTTPFVKHTHPGEEIIYASKDPWSIRSRASPRPRSRLATSGSSRPERSTRSATSAAATPPSSPPTSSRKASPSIPLRPPMTRDAAGTLLGQTMGLVAVTAGLFAVGAYLGRNLAYHWGWLLFIAGFGAAGYATRRDSRRSPASSYGP